MASDLVKNAPGPPWQDFAIQNRSDRLRDVETEPKKSNNKNNNLSPPPSPPSIPRPGPFIPPPPPPPLQPPPSVFNSFQPPPPRSDNSFGNFHILPQLSSANFGNRNQGLSGNNKKMHSLNRSRKIIILIKLKMPLMKVLSFTS